MALIYKYIVHGLLSLLVLLLLTKSGMAETDSTYPYVDLEALKKESAEDSDSKNNLRKQNNSSSYNSKSNRSIKMIVGGQSEDGVAKELNVPVKE